jgi:hypothetical protein
MISRWPWPRRDSSMVDCTRITATKKNSAARTTAAGSNKSALPACRISVHIQRIIQRSSRSWIPTQEHGLRSGNPAPRAHLGQPSADLCVFFPMSIVCAATQLFAYLACSYLSRSRVFGRQIPTTVAVTHTLVLSFPDRTSISSLVHTPSEYDLDVPRS